MVIFWSITACAVILFGLLFVAADIMIGVASGVPNHDSGLMLAAGVLIAAGFLLFGIGRRLTRPKKSRPRFQSLARKKVQSDVEQLKAK